MNVVAVLAALATIFAGGFGLLHLILCKPERLHLAEQLAVSWLAGSAVVSLSIWSIGFFARGGILFAIIAAECLALPLLAWKIKGSIRFQALRALSFIECALACVLVIEVLAIFYLSFVHTLGWDGLLNWEIKARYAFSTGGVLSGAYFQDTGRLFSHAEYPLGIPFSQLWLYLWLGETNQFWAKTIFPMFYASGAVLVAAIGTRLTGKLWAGLIAAVVLFFVPQITVEPDSAMIGYADFPLSAFYLGALGYLLCATLDDSDDCFRIYAICLAALPWIKREGIILWLVAALCGVLMVWRRRWPRKCFGAILPGLCIAAGWHIYLRQMRAVSPPDFVPINFHTLAANFQRIGSISAAVGSAIIDKQAWGLFWLIAGVSAIYLARQSRNDRALILFTGVGAPIAIYALGYVFSAWPDYQHHIELSIARLLMHVAPLALVPLSVALPSLPWRDVVRPRDRSVPSDKRPLQERLAYCESTTSSWQLSHEDSELVSSSPNRCR